MINLIPPRAKKALLLEYWVRVVSVWLILWSSALLLGALLLVPVQVLISSQVSVYKESSVAASQSVSSYENASTLLAQSTQQAKYVFDEKEFSSMSGYLDLFQSLEGTEVEIKTINLARKESDVSPVSISGFAANRHALASFRDRIVSQEEFLEVDLPISNLAQDRDISFSITVTLDNQIKI
jgi:hypothetical protein